MGSVTVSLYSGVVFEIFTVYEYSYANYVIDENCLESH